jgi:hypothetical protein
MSKGSSDVDWFFSVIRESERELRDVRDSAWGEPDPRYRTLTWMRGSCYNESERVWSFELDVSQDRTNDYKHGNEYLGSVKGGEFSLQWVLDSTELSPSWGAARRSPT